MKHLLKKLSIAGGGGSKKPKPPVFNPPVMGELQYGSSYSYAETLDLISDGPIEGIVNANGKIVDGLEILQGIYLDDTAVAVTTNTDRIGPQLTNLETETIETLNMELDSTEGVTSCSRFFQELLKAPLRSSDGRITALPSNTAGGVHNNETSSSADVAMVYLELPAPFWSPWFPNQRNQTIATYVRGFLKYRDSSGSQSFQWYLNGTQQLGYNDSNAAFRQDDRSPGTLGSLLWSDSNLDLSKFFFSFQPNAELIQLETGWDLEADAIRTPLFTENKARINEVVYDELNTIYELFANNNQQGGNEPQRKLAEKALKALNFTEGNVNDLVFNYLNEEEYGGAIIVKVEDLNANLNKSIVDGDQLFNMSTLPVGLQNGFDLIAVMERAGMRVTDVTCPEISADGTLNRNMHGFLIFEFPIEKDRLEVRTADSFYISIYACTFKIPIEVIEALADLNSFKFAKTLNIDGSSIIETDATVNNFDTTNLKYNYSNVLAEFKKGEELQDPFSYFRRIFIDHIYDRELFGPFGTAPMISVADVDNLGNNVTRQKNAPQRISRNASMLTKSAVLSEFASNYNTALGDDRLPLNEGSDDVRASRGNKNYSNWGENSLANFDEKEIPVIHTIYNPNVEQVFVTLDVRSLKDTLITDTDNVRTGRSGQKDLSIGTTFPSVLNIRVETGTVRENGGLSIHREYTYRIVALIEGNTLIDIGNPDYKAASSREFVIEIGSVDDDEGGYLAKPFELPKAEARNQEVLSADGEVGIEAGALEQEAHEKRYVKISKLSYETNSTLLAKEISVKKVTEIIQVNLPYPYSAIVGTKLDSRAFGSIPKRSFDCKLKKVKVPSNYFPSKRGKDKRYYNNQELFDNTPRRDKLIYKGDWDGSFRGQLIWTDNPAWILYDLLTSSRYGMGSHIDSDTINKWQLYKIGRFCDAVDEDGYFEGVTDGRGGKEPRYSCNIVFDKGQKIFDAINTIASLFRGRTFFSNSEINFVDDRPRGAVNLFTNESVKDGLFFYSNNRRDEQFNCIEVGYRDRFDNFSPKIEVVEDEEDIRERGVFKKKIEGIGITSRAMARRTAQHQIFSKIKENQQVAFTAGLESLLCKPGDLVIIEDELKTNVANFGKVLAVDLEAETIRLTNQFNSSSMTGFLSVYNPTGSDSYEELEQIANSRRQRFDSFTVTGMDSADYVRYTGDYGFSGYTKGYPEATGEGDPRFQQYAAYTGLAESGTMVYFDPVTIGWIFASGTGSSPIDLRFGDFISELTGTQTLSDLNTGKLAIYNPNRTRGAANIFSGITNFEVSTRGITESELSVATPNQISILSVTGSVIDQDYGSIVSGFNDPSILPFVKLGSPAKFERPQASPFFYKVISMQEEATNEYLVTATKYDTGKFNLIDKNISIENEANTFSYQVAQTINGVTYKTLDAPALDNVTTGVPNASDGTFTITGMWTGITPDSTVTGYNMVLDLPNGQSVSEFVANPITGGEFTGLNQVGVYNFKVNALGNRAGSAGNAYFDSDYSSSGIFVLYEESLTFSKSFLDRITIL